MATGKSTVGRRAAELLRVPFVDLDVCIEEMTSSTVPELFQRFGENGFRSFESAALARVLQEQGQVVATGGGAVVAEQNWELVTRGNLVVALTASEEVILDRIGQGEGRPLATVDGDTLVGLLHQRTPRYAQASHCIDTSATSEPEAAEAVARIARAVGFSPASHA